MSSLTLFVGIAVAQDTLDIAVRPTAETWQVANETASLNALVAQLETMAPALVRLEAPGAAKAPCSRRWLSPGAPWGVPTPARSGPLPRPAGSWRKRIGLMRVCWPTSRQQ